MLYFSFAKCCHVVSHSRLLSFLSVGDRKGRERMEVPPVVVYSRSMGHVVNHRGLRRIVVRLNHLLRKHFYDRLGGR